MLVLGYIAVVSELGLAQRSGRLGFNLVLTLVVRSSKRGEGSVPHALDSALRVVVVNKRSNGLAHRLNNHLLVVTVLHWIVIVNRRGAGWLATHIPWRRELAPVHRQVDYSLLVVDWIVILRVWHRLHRLSIVHLLLLPALRVMHVYVAWRILASPD